MSNMTVLLRYNMYNTSAISTNWQRDSSATYLEQQGQNPMSYSDENICIPKMTMSPLSFLLILMISRISAGNYDSFCPCHSGLSCIKNVANAVHGECFLMCATKYDDNKNYSGCNVSGDKLRLYLVGFLCLAQVSWLLRGMSHSLLDVFALDFWNIIVVP